MKVAVITPYYRESTEVLLRCIRSVREQTHEVHHICIADGEPNDGVLFTGITHIVIPNSRDVGTTPRNVGMLVAMAQEVDAMAFLDADCWIEPDHIQSMVQAMQANDAPVVTSPRNLRRPDGSLLGKDTESDGLVFNDTNCVLIRRDAFPLLDAWFFAPRELSLVHDRVFWKRVVESGVRCARTDKPTVNYTTTFAAHYLQHGEDPPDNAKVILQTPEGWQLMPHKDVKQVSVELHTLAWPNTNDKLVSAHYKVNRHFGLNIQYTREQIPHGEWMNRILQSSTADVVGFLDIDCIPLNRSAVENAAAWAAHNKSFVGIAQCSNHIPPASHIFAAPAFFFIHRQAWLDLGRPTFSETQHADVAENVSYAAEVARLRYRTLYPTHYTLAPKEGIWPLHTYGVFGIGTVFETGVYHLYQGRFADHVNLFSKVCDQVVEGTFSTEGLNPCR